MCKKLLSLGLVLAVVMMLGINLNVNATTYALSETLYNDELIGTYTPRHVNKKYVTAPEKLNLNSTFTAKEPEITEDAASPSFYGTKYKVTFWYSDKNNNQIAEDEVAYYDEGEVIGDNYNQQIHGYTFDSWYNKEGTIEITDFANTPVTGDVIYNAVYRTNSYTVKFVSRAAVVKEITLPYGVYIRSSNTPSETELGPYLGQKFEGWKTPSFVPDDFGGMIPYLDNKGIEYVVPSKDFDSLRVLGNLTFTAQWSTTFNYVTFNYNGGTPGRGVSIPKDGAVVQYSPNDKLGTKVVDPSRENYVFKYWKFNDEIIGDTDTTRNMQVIVDGELKACWNTIITFSLNGGTIEGSPNDVRIIVDADEIIGESNVPITNRGQYNFKGWKNSSDGMLYSNAQVAEYIAKESTIFTAQWNLRVIYVDADYPDTPMIELEIEPEDLESNGNYIPNEIEVPGRGTLVPLDPEVTPDDNGVVTVPAVFMHNVTFKSNGGVIAGSQDDLSFRVKADTAVTEAKVPTATRGEYIFGGWKNTADGTVYTINGVSSYLVNGDTTFVAQWNYIAKYVTEEGEVIITLEVEPEELIDGKYTTEVSDIPGQGILTPIYPEVEPDDNTGVITIISVFMNYVRFAPNGGIIAGSPNDVIFKIKSGEVISAANVPTVVRGEYIFAGWNSSIDGNVYTTAQVADFQVNDEITFTAQWNYVGKYVIPGGEVIRELEITPGELVSGKYKTEEVEVPGRGILVPDYSEEAPDEVSGLIIVPCTFMYGVTFNQNGGTANGSTEDIGIRVVAETAIGADKVPTTVKGEYIFKGWKQSVTGIVYTTDEVASYEVNEITTFMAQWNLKVIYIDPDDPDTSIIELEIQPEDFESNGNYIPSEIEVPGQGILVPLEPEVTPGNNGVVIVPATFMHNVTFKPNGGVIAGFQDDLSFRVKAGMAVSEAKVPVTTKGEYIFSGWKNTADGIVYTVDGVGNYVVNGETTFIAQWNYIAKYVTEEGEVVITLQVEPEELIDGKYPAEEQKVPGRGILTPFYPEVEPDHNTGVITIVSVFKYNVTFVLNGGTIEGSSNDVIIKVKASEVIDETNVPTVIRNAYDFTGWKCSLDDVVYTSGHAAKYIVNDAVTFTAQWKAKEIVVDPEPVTLTSAFAGNCESNTGEYFVVIGGVVSGKFAEGINTLTYEQILAQDISIFIINTVQYDNRTMATSTINSIKVTVENEAIVSVTIYGRAQTPKGNFDTYTITIPVL